MECIYHELFCAFSYFFSVFPKPSLRKLFSFLIKHISLEKSLISKNTFSFHYTKFIYFFKTVNSTASPMQLKTKRKLTFGDTQQHITVVHCDKHLIVAFRFHSLWKSALAFSAVTLDSSSWRRIRDGERILCAAPVVA